MTESNTVLRPLPEELLLATLFCTGVKMYDRKKFEAVFLAEGAKDMAFAAFAPHPQYGHSKRLGEAITCLVCGASLTSSTGPDLLIVSKSVLSEYGKKHFEVLPGILQTEIRVVAIVLREAASEF